jgi:hypothetical protein
VQLKLDPTWFPAEEPTISIETVRVEMVGLMAAAIVATQGITNEEEDDERHTPEDR